MGIFVPVTYDKFDQQETPYVILCNPDREQLASLGTMYDSKFDLKFNALSEFSFTFPQKVGDIIQPAYDILKAKRVILIEKFGWFIINNVDEKTDGVACLKYVIATSLESELMNKKLNSLSGTFFLYSYTYPERSFLNIITNGTGWNFNVDPSIESLQRTFDISDSNVYNVLMNDMEKSYGCVVTFNTSTRNIIVEPVSKALNSSDIYLSYNNLIKNAIISEKSDEIVTALSVYGGDGLTIHSVNPLGTNYIYDFNHFATPEWMSADLINAVTLWQQNILNNQTAYSNLLTSYSLKNGELIILNSTLTTHKSELMALNIQKKAIIESRGDLGPINALILIKNNEIASDKINITTKTNEINVVKSSISGINTLVSFATNFTTQQLIELKPYIIENTYQNDSIITYDGITEVDFQAQATLLFNFAKDVLTKISVPRYEFTMDISNFMALKEYYKFTSDLELGTIMTIEIKENEIIQNVLLQITFSLDKPTEATFIFGNRLRLDNGSFIFSDLFGETVKNSSNVSFDKYAWANWQNNYKDTVSTFINSSLNTARNELINSDNQEITIDASGLHGRTLVATNPELTYDSHQMWMTSNTIAFSEDSFETASLALGKIDWNGQDRYGLVADVIVGRLLAGNALQITNSSSNFTLDDNGAVLSNASLTIINNDAKILLNPDVGIKIQASVGTLPVLPTANITQTNVGISVSSISLAAFPLSSHTNRIIVLSIGSNKGNTPTVSAKFDDNDMTLLRSTVNTNNNARAEMWYYIVPFSTASGNKNVTVILPSSTYAEIAVTEYYNVNPTVPFGTVISAPRNTTFATVDVSSDVNDLVIDTVVYWSNTMVVNPSQTELYNITSDGNWKLCGSLERALAGIQTTMNWSVTSNTNSAQIGVALKPSSPEIIYEDRFYADSSGNIFLTGVINATSGKIGNWNINSSGLTTSIPNLVGEQFGLSFLFGTGNYSYIVESNFGALKTETAIAANGTMTSTNFQLFGVGDNFISADALWISGEDIFIQAGTSLQVRNTSNTAWLPTTTATINLNTYKTLNVVRGLIVGYST